MPRLKHEADPAYRLHRQSGQAIVTLSGLDFPLGPFGTAASRDRYHELILRWRKGGKVADRAWRDKNAGKPAAETATINTIVAKYKEYVEGYYRNVDRTPKDEASVWRLSPSGKSSAQPPRRISLRRSWRPSRTLWSSGDGAEITSIARDRE
jgi:hypothetical protein